MASGIPIPCSTLIHKDLIHIVCLNLHVCVCVRMCLLRLYRDEFGGEGFVLLPAFRDNFVGNQIVAVQIREEKNRERVRERESF